MSTERIPWIDVLKGIGIVAVVVGHTWEPAHDYLFWFHMPLFFCISGYLYSSPGSSRQYLVRKARHLLVPYLCFLFLLSLPEYVTWTVRYLEHPSWNAWTSILWLTAKKLHGGWTLTAWFAVFWFVTCLFFTQQAYHWINRRLGHNRPAMLALAIAAYLLALANALFMPRLIVPWTLNVVPMAFFFYCLGHQARLVRFTPGWYALPALLLVLLAVFLERQHIVDLEFSMKSVRYGVPFFSVGLALSCIVLVQGVSRILSTQKLTRGLFVALGQASMVTMYLHWAVQDLLFRYLGVASPWARIILTLGICFVVYRLLASTAWTAQLFVGVGPGATPRAAQPVSARL